MSYAKNDIINPVNGDNLKIIDIYEFVIKEPDRYIESKIPKKVKLNTLNLLLQFFEKEEAYEKCKIIYDIVLAID